MLQRSPNKKTNNIVLIIFDQYHCSEFSTTIMNFYSHYTKVNAALVTLFIKKMYILKMQLTQTKLAAPI